MTADSFGMCLLELVDRKLGVAEIEQKLSGLLGDSREVPDVPTSTAE